jgi:hypothetical protein
MEPLLLCSISFAAVGISSSIALTLNRPLKIQQLRAEVDEDFVRELDELLDAQPGNPHDAEVWALIRQYGIRRMIHQARVQVGIATETLKLYPERGTDRLDAIRAAVPSITNALIGCGVECIIGRAYPQTTHVQALAAAHAFNWLRIDVEELCSADGGA